MQITETNTDGLKRELKVVVAAAELDGKLSEKLDELKDRVQLKGFRPGKIPITHLRKVYGRSVMAEVVQKTVAETSQKALSERDLRPAFEPEITFTEDEKEISDVMDGKADLSYTMSFEILPDFELSDLSKLKLEKEIAEADDKAVSEGIERLAEDAVTYEEKDGAAESGDQIMIDFVGKIDGEPFEGGSSEDAPLVLGTSSFIPGFEEGLLGSKAGEEQVVEATFPEDYPVKDLAGKVAQFDVKVKEVKRAVPPEINDDFAKTLGLESLDKLKDAVRERITEEYDKASRSKLKRTLLDELDKTYTFDLPPTLVEREYDAIWSRVNSRLEQAGSSFEDEGTSEEAEKEVYRKVGERRVRLGLVLSEVGEKNSIQVNDDEVQKALVEQVRRYPGQEKEVFEFYRKNPQATAELRAPLFEEKVVDFILELAEVNEKKVSTEELFKMPDDAADKAAES